MVQLATVCRQWLVHKTVTELLSQIPNPSPALTVLLPLAVPDDQAVRRQAASWVQTIRQAPGLEVATQVRLVELLTKFLMQRFENVPWKEIESMLRLVPVEETRAGRDLIEQGVQQGVQETLYENIIDALEVRLGPAPESLAETVRQVTDIAVLKQLHRLAVMAPSLEMFEHECARLAG